MNEGLEHAVSDGTELLYRSAQNTINKKRGYSGGTVTTIRQNVTGLEGRVYSEDMVAQILEEGSRPHPIPQQPKPPGKWLRFPWHGEIVFAKQVNHPGTPAFHWLYRAGEQSDAEIKRGFDTHISNILGRA
jgi:hypothetical protein